MTPLRATLVTMALTLARAGALTAPRLAADGRVSGRLAREVVAELRAAGRIERAPSVADGRGRGKRALRYRLA